MFIDHAFNKLFFAGKIHGNNICIKCLNYSQMRSLFAILSVFFLLSSYKAASQDSAILPASTKYETSLIFRKLFIGNNNRKTWALPVKMPIFDISKEKPGLRITKLGGGAQTKSLRMEDRDSIEWVLRTVDKDVAGVLPKKLKKTFIKRIVQDMISTAYPYAPLVVGSLSKALRIDAPDPVLFYVPDDTALGEFRDDLAHKVCLFERTTPTRDNTAAISTDSLFKIINENNEQRIDDTSFLKGRLLDMLIVDWDRHQEQYKWGVTRQKASILYYPIFRDRDQAFFYSDGFLLLGTRLFAVKYMTNFTKKVRKLRQLNKRSWKLDQAILNGLDENDWRRIIADFQHTLNDVVLDAAVKKLPAEAYQKDGELIFQILKARRDRLTNQAMSYYAFLSKKVIITCSNGEEQVKIMNDSGGLKINVYDKQSRQIVYERLFSEKQTKEIHILLLGGDDELIVDENTSSTVKVFFDGGTGKNTFILRGRLSISEVKEQGIVLDAYEH